MKRPVLAILVALWIMTFASTSQVLIVSPILPRISAEIPIPEGFGGALIASYGALAFLFALISGPIGDRYGRRPILVAGTLAMAIALWLHLLAWDFLSLLVLRAIAGAAGGVLAGAAVAYVGDYFPYERRGWANGWVMSGFALGQVVGIPIGTAMAGHLGFRSPFLGFALLMTLATALTALGLPQPDVKRAEALGLGRALSTYWNLARRRVTGTAALSYILTFLGVGLHIAYLTTWLQQRFDVGDDDVAILFALGSIAAVFANPVSGMLSDRIGRKPLIVAACVAFGVGAAATPYAIVQYWVAYPVLAFTMAAASTRVPPIQSLVSAITGAEERGAMLSLGSALGQLGFAIGGGVAGLLYVQAGYAASTWIAGVSLVAAGVVIGLFVPEPKSA